MPVFLKTGISEILSVNLRKSRDKTNQLMTKEKTVETTPILFRKEGKVGVITLNRPDRYNAITLALRNDLMAALAKCNNDKEIKAVVITGAGRGFSAGADLKDTSSGPMSPMDVRDDLMLTFANVIKRIVYMEKPVIAAINGNCAGAAVGIALACDFKFMADSACIRYAFINIALVPDAGSSWFLTRAVGYNKAMEIITGGEKIPAAECHRLGLVNKLAPKEDTLATAMEFAHKLANGPTKAIAATKRIISYALTHSLNDTMDLEAIEQGKIIYGKDNIEGVTAFLEKRPPLFE